MIDWTLEKYTEAAATKKKNHQNEDVQEEVIIDNIVVELDKKGI